MVRKRLMLLTFIALTLFITVPAFSQNGSPSQTPDRASSLEEVIKVGNNSIIEGDWAKAESNFREAVRLEPRQTLWRIQLILALGQQKKWKEAFKEFDKVTELGVMDWVLTINEKMPDGSVAFVNTETFGDEKRGIFRYVKAVKERKKVNSISNDIGAKLADFAKRNNLALIYDVSRFKDTSF